MQEVIAVDSRVVVSGVTAAVFQDPVVPRALRQLALCVEESVDLCDYRSTAKTCHRMPGNVLRQKLLTLRGALLVRGQVVAVLSARNDRGLGKNCVDTTTGS